MNIQINYFYEDAESRIANISNEIEFKNEEIVAEEVIVQFVTDWLIKNEITEQHLQSNPNFILDFRRKVYETPIYVVCRFEEEENTLHLLIATKKDAVENKNNELIASIKAFEEKKLNN